MPRPFIITVAAALLAGCASAPMPPLTEENPASPNAIEGSRIKRATSLSADGVTSKSHALLSTAQREQEYWDKYGPVSGTPEDAAKPDTKMEMNHDHH